MPSLRPSSTSGEDTSSGIFAPSARPGAQTVSRAWHFRIPDAGVGRIDLSPHKIVFRHSFAAGHWVLIVDGVVHLCGFEPIFNRKFVVEFKLDGNDATLTAIGRSGLGYSHKLIINCIEVTEIKKQTDLLIGESIPTHISIPDTRTFNDGSRDVTLYQIFVKSANGGQIIIERRFSEFSVLSDLIKAQKDDRSLQGNLPSLPRKTFMPWVDQTKATFIEARREALQQYMQTALSNPRVPYYTEFLCFLGLNPATGEPIAAHMSGSLIISSDEEGGFRLAT